MLRIPIIAAILLFTMPVLAALAEAGPSQSLKDFAEVHPDCFEWSDGCTVCARQDSENYHCSLPGIACLPKPLTCRHASGNVPPSPPAPYSAPTPD